MAWHVILIASVCFSSALCADLQAIATPAPANISTLAYKVDLRLTPELRWVSALEDYVAQRGTHAFRDFYSSVLSSLESVAADVLGYYRDNIHEFMAAYARHLPDAYGEMISLANVLSAHATNPEEKKLFSHESVFLAQQHMEIMSIAPMNNSSIARGVPRNGECTSVLVRRPGKPLLHFRNWDFGPEPKALGTASVQVDFLDNYGGFRCLMALTHIAKFTTCMRPGAYAMSLNAREYGFGYERGRAPAEQLRLLQEGRLPREGVLRKMMFSRSYSEAVEIASTALAMTSLYAIVSNGQNSSEGVVVTVMGNGSKADVWSLNDTNREDAWFLVQTNVDHWMSMSERNPSSHRREHVKAKLRQLGPQASTKELFEVLQDSSVFPEGNTGRDDGRIFRPSTVASVLMEPSWQLSLNNSWKTVLWQAVSVRKGSSASVVV